ncbi:MAG: zinc ribbon domain-containing protein [Gaiellales bacterium]|nr:zinc ribbon domain-containing protein [Gaiellales bacterium]
MPIYEYQCPGCSLRFEELVSLSAAGRPQRCPHCGCSDSRRVLSSFAIRVGGGRASAGGKSCAGCSRSSCAGC